MNAAWIVVIAWITKGVMALLVGLSVWSGAVAYGRWRQFGRSDDRELRDSLKARILAGDWVGLRQLVESAAGLRGRVIREVLALGPQSAESLERAYRSTLTEARAELEQGFTVLATLGSNAPFIGLFGTVLGIIQAFGALAGNKGDMNVVMFLIAEALIATAIGLFVAIPAVVAYNVFSRRLRNMVVDCDSLKDLYLSRLPRGTER